MSSERELQPRLAASEASGRLPVRACTATVSALKVRKQLAFGTQERNEQDRLLGGQPRQAAPGSYAL